MEARSRFVSDSRDSAANVRADSTFDEYDELSDATVGTSSPLGRMETQSPRSDSKNRTSARVSPSLESAEQRTFAEPPKQLPLNPKNLHGFSAEVERGNLPLRADVIPTDEYVTYAPDATAAGARKRVAEQKERGDVSVVTAAGRTQDAGDLGSDAIDSNTLCSNASLHGGEASLEGNAWNVERASVDAQVGSPTRRHADPLSTANLDQHLHELSRGPAPLFVENVVTNIPPIVHERDGSTMATMATAAEEPAPSVAIDPSEMDTQSYSEAISPNRNRSMKQFSVGDAMDDMWSTASTRGRDASQFVHPNGDENPHALSKENLRQLRHQLESGETPLRPEVLAGLGSMVRVMTQTNSNPSASMRVEPAATETRSKQLEAGSPMRSLADMQSPVAMGSLGATLKESELNATAGMSFHSTLVEVPPTEPGDRRGGHEGEYPSRRFTASEQVDASNLDVDDEDVGVDNVDEDEEEEVDAGRGKSSTNDSREGQNESVFNMTEDDVGDYVSDNNAMTRHMRELFKLVQEGQRDQSHLRQQVLEQRSVIERLQNTVRVLETELSALKKQ